LGRGRLGEGRSRRWPTADAERGPRRSAKAYALCGASGAPLRSRALAGVNPPDIQRLGPPFCRDIPRGLRTLQSAHQNLASRQARARPRSSGYYRHGVGAPLATTFL